MRALALHDDPIHGLLPIFVTICVWMFVSYAIVYASASIVATIMLRKHAWKFAIATPMAGRRGTFTQPFALFFNVKSSILQENYELEEAVLV